MPRDHQINDDAVLRIAQQGVAKLLRKKAERKIYRCKDRMCGADDCPTCYPATYEQALSELDALDNETDE
jgi:hypothetical protein